MLEPFVPARSPRLVWSIVRLAAVAVVAVVIGIGVAAWRFDELRARQASADEAALKARLAEQLVELRRCLDGGCGLRPDHDRELADLQAAQKRLLELQCARRRAKLVAALGANDPVTWVLEATADEVRSYRAACAADSDGAIAELERRLAETTHDTGTGLDRSMISTGMQAIRSAVIACGDRSSAKGVVKLHVRVAPDGIPRTITIGTSPNAALGECVRRAVANARFAATERGGSFSYPFVF